MTAKIAKALVAYTPRPKPKRAPKYTNLAEYQEHCNMLAGLIGTDSEAKNATIDKVVKDAAQFGASVKFNDFVRQSRQR